MNHRKLTQRNLKFQILLLVSLIPLLSVSGFAQATSQLKEETESFSETVRTEKQAKDQDRRRPTSRFSSRWTRTIEGEDHLFTEKTPLEITSKNSGGSSSQPASDLTHFAVFGDVGVTVPHGDFNLFVDPDFSANVGLEYIITSQFSAVGTLGYHRFSTFFDEHATLYQVSGNAKFYLVDESSNVRPFVNGGIGLYVTDSGSTHFGGNVGGGVLFNVTEHVGIQGSYNFHAVSIGDTIKFSTVQGGIRFRF